MKEDEEETDEEIDPERNLDDILRILEIDTDEERDTGDDFETPETTSEELQVDEPTDRVRVGKEKSPQSTGGEEGEKATNEELVVEPHRDPDTEPVPRAGPDYEHEIRTDKI